VAAAARRPSFQFYPGDWLLNANLSRCSWAARGAWIAVLAKLHDSDEYGVARYPLKELAKSIGAPFVLLRELADKGVLKGCDAGSVTRPFIYIPRSGRGGGPPQTLIGETPGPIWYSSRLVKDEYVRRVRGEHGKFTPGHDSENPSPKASPKGGFGEWQGDGSSSSSSSSMNTLGATHLEHSSRANHPSDGLSPTELATPPPDPEFKLNGHAYSLPDCPHQKVIELWGKILPQLPQPLAWRGQRVEHLKTRWRELAAEHHWPDQQAGLKFFAKVFRFVGQSRFLTGQKTGKDGRAFTAELPWVVRPENFLKVIEGKYHQDES